MVDIVASNDLAINFHRQLTGVTRHEWNDILHLIHSFHADTEEDTVRSNFNSTWKFTVKSFYQFLTFRVVKEMHTLTWRDLKTPPKIQVLMWLLNRKKNSHQNSISCQMMDWGYNLSFLPLRKNPRSSICAVLQSKTNLVLDGEM